MDGKASNDSVFGELIFSYSRAQAIADGVLIDVGPMAREAGFRFPVALTQSVWADCVAWETKDSERQTYQDPVGRLWDVLFSAYLSLRGRQCVASADTFELHRIPRDGRSVKPVSVWLKIVIGPGDDGKPVMTIMTPFED